jgi:hypothetical protein
MNSILRKWVESRGVEFQWNPWYSPPPLIGKIIRGGIDLPPFEQRGFYLILKTIFLKHR